MDEGFICEKCQAELDAAPPLVPVALCDKCTTRMLARPGRPPPVTMSHAQFDRLIHGRTDPKTAN